MGMDPKWLEWAKQIQALAQTGLAYTKDVYDVERYEALREISIDIMNSYTAVDREIIKLSFANERGYATPKVDIRGVVFKDNKILLVQEKLDGDWALPGGWGDIGLSPTEVAVKEIKEESGYEAVPVRLLAVLDKNSMITLQNRITSINFSFNAKLSAVRPQRVLRRAARLF